jgi:DNA-binding MarR family transcriptional regulator
MPEDRFQQDVVALMRGDVAQLGESPEHALRLVMRLAGGLERLLVQLRRSLGLHTHEFAALLGLWDGGRSTVGEVGDRVGLSRAATTTLVDHLVQLDYVERVPDPDDRRRVLVTITPKFERELWAASGTFGEQLRAVAAEDSARWAAFASAASSVRSEAAETAASLRAELKAKPVERATKRRGRKTVSLDDANW